MTPLMMRLIGGPQKSICTKKWNMHKMCHVPTVYKEITLTCNDSSFFISFGLLRLQSQDTGDMTLGWFDRVNEKLFERMWFAVELIFSFGK